MNVLAATGTSIAAFVAWIGIAVAAVVGGFAWVRHHRKKQDQYEDEDNLSI